MAPKASYAKRDFERSARFAGVPYRQPSRFPIGSVAAKRSVVWLQQHRPELVAPFIHAVYRAFFVDDRDISDAAVVGDIAREIGIDPDELAAGVQQPEVKDRLRALVDHAIQVGHLRRADNHCRWRGLLGQRSNSANRALARKGVVLGSN